MLIPYNLFAQGFYVFSIHIRLHSKSYLLYKNVYFVATKFYLLTLETNISEF